MPKPEQEPKPKPPTLDELRALRERGRTPEQQKRYDEVSARAKALYENGIAAPKGASYGDGGKAPVRGRR